MIPPLSLWCLRGAVLALALSSGVASAQIYRCESPNGVVEYSNTPSSRADRACRPVDLPAINTIPAPSMPRPPVPAGTAPGVAPGAAQGEAARPSGSPPSFPRVDNATQKARDADRRRILQEELQKEEARLAELRKEYNGGEPERRGEERNYQKYLDRVQRLKDDIGRSEVNISSLKRELATVRD